MAKKLSDVEIVRQIPRAKLQGRLLEAQPWWPKSVAFDLEQDALHLKLRSGVEWIIPRTRIPELKRAAKDDLERVELSGEAIRWDSLDIDISIPGLAIDTLGESFFAKTSGKIRGGVSTKAKAAAARRNGAKGGRPRKAGSAR